MNFSLLSRAFKTNLFGNLFFNFLIGIDCCIQLLVAMRFDFPYKAGFYSDYVLGSLLNLMILSVVWNLAGFIRLVIKLKQNSVENC